MPDPSFLNPISVLTQFNPGLSGGISIDITQKVTENYPKIITTNPIENGSPTTDHIVNLPPRLQIQGGFSDLKVTNLTGTTINSLTGDLSVRNRAKGKFDQLLELSLSNKLFTIMDGFHLFKNMQFSDLKLLKDKEGFSIFFQADIQGIKVVNLSSNTTAIKQEDALTRNIVANATQLTVGATVEREAFASIGILA